MRIDTVKHDTRWTVRKINHWAAALVLVLGMVTYASAQSRNSVTASNRTFWKHNGSVVYLVTDGTLREFYYDQPRPGMIEAGWRAGAVVFRGRIIWGRD